MILDPLKKTTDNAAQGRAEITEHLTAKGKYIPTPKYSRAVVENVCAHRLHESVNKAQTAIMTP